MATKRILGIDIGSYATRAVLVETKDDNPIVDLIAINSVESKGIKKGSIANIEQAAKSIRAAVEGIVNNYGSHIDKYVVGVSGNDTMMIAGEDTSNIEREREIDVRQIERLVTSAQGKPTVPHGFSILHTLPCRFTLDNKNVVEDPRGMSATRLKAEINLIVLKETTMTNLRNAVKRAATGIVGDLRSDNFVLSSYASAISTLTEDEKSVGTVLIDMGHSTCNVALYCGNTILFSDFLPVGSNSITQDISTMFHTPLNIAEDIKQKYLSYMHDNRDEISVPDMGDPSVTHDIPLDAAIATIYARVEDTFKRLKARLDKHGMLAKAAGGIVITGGMSRLSNIKDIAQFIFSNCNVRIAKPSDSFIRNISESQRTEMNSCVLGLCLYGAGHFTTYEIDSEQNLKYKDELAGRVVEQPKHAPAQQVVVSQKESFDKKFEFESESVGLFAKICNWFKNMF